MNLGNARIWARNARVHLYARRVYSQADALRMAPAISANLKELRFGS
jgi:hypothetical protein